MNAYGQHLVRVEKGDADPEELAALVTVLLARAAARDTGTAVVTSGEEAGGTAGKAGWRRLERQNGFPAAPQSWTRPGS